MSVVWLNGVLLAAESARIDPADRGFTLGDGIFETIRVMGGVPAHLDRHLARLAAGARVLGLSQPWPDHALWQAMTQVLTANAMSDAALRLTVTRGPAPRGVLPAGDAAATVLVTAGDLPASLPPARVMVAQSVRRNEFSPLARIKSLNYLDSIIARREAAACGADDALLLNTQGFVAEATAATLFIRVAGHWLTPPVADGALPGVMRGVILAQRAAREARVTLDLLGVAEAAFLANSLGRRGIARIDGRVLGEAGSVLF